MASLAVVVKQLGRKHGRSDEELERLVMILEEHWISTLDQWRAMSPTLRRKIALPLVLEQELDGMEDDNRGPVPPPLLEGSRRQLCYLFHNRADETVFIAAGENIWRQRCTDKVAALLERIPSPAALLLADGSSVSPEGSLGVALQPKRVLMIEGEMYEIVSSMHFRGVENWLSSLGLRHLASVFLEFHVADFMVIPFLQQTDLDDMGIKDADAQQKILASVADIQAGSFGNFMGLWLHFAGFASCLSSMSRTPDDDEFRLLKAGNFEALGIPPDEAAFVDSCMQQFSEYTSIEATHGWLCESGFSQYAFNFVRANIPFYALPLVNFFIINEMGITDLKLWRAIRTLKSQPAYRVKAMAYWLRDLDLQQYTLVFAKNLLVDFIEAQTILTDSTIAQLIQNEQHRVLMKRAVDDIRKLKAYFAITDSFLTDDLIEKYSDAFAAYGHPLTAKPIHRPDLVAMGITDETDLLAILRSLRWVSEQFAPALYSQATPLGYHSFSLGATKRNQIGDSLFETAPFPKASELQTQQPSSPAVRATTAVEEPSSSALGLPSWATIGIEGLSLESQTLHAFPWLR